MAPNLGGKRTKRNKKAPAVTESDKYTPFADPGKQMYAVVTKMLGNRRLMVKGTDNKEVLATIPGKFKGKRYWVKVGMVVLLGIREYQYDKTDVIYIYNSAEVKLLRKMNEIDTLVTDEDTECGFVFGGEGDSDLDIDSDTANDVDIADINLDDL